MNNKIYRYRSCEKYVIEELQDSYLWFSKPKGFKGDSNDANIGAFVLHNRPILRGLLYRYSKESIKRWIKYLSNIGICCFSRTKPCKKLPWPFPGCKQFGICIEFDKSELETFFITHKSNPIYPCFSRVKYAKHPIKLGEDGEWHILIKSTKEGKLYKTISGMLANPREFDDFIRILLSRISNRFSKQKEERIILFTRNSLENNNLGYKVYFTKDLIKKVYIHRNCPIQFKKQIENIDYLKGRIEYL